jgi:uncharacterized caspase-like protein
VILTVTHCAGVFATSSREAEASGPGTVAVVYLAGYGMQLAGENYFIRSTPRSIATPTFRSRGYGSATISASSHRFR